MALPPPPPRLCHLVKWEEFEGYGFNLYAEKNKPGQYIGEIDPDSPAEAAGLQEGDRIIEVNGVNVNMENHRQVVQRIKAVVGETRLLVVDQKSADWHRDRRVLVKASLPYVIHLSSKKALDKSDRDGTEQRPSANHNEVLEEVTAIDSSRQTSSSRSASVCSLPSVEVGEQFKTEISISVTFSDDGSDDMPEELNGVERAEAVQVKEEDSDTDVGEMSHRPATDVDVVTGGGDERIFTAEKVEAGDLPKISSIEKETAKVVEEEKKFDEIEIDENEAYAAFFSNDRVGGGGNNSQGQREETPKNTAGGGEGGEEVTIIKTKGPAAGVDLVVGDPDQEDPRLHQQEESVSGEKSADEQDAVEETEVSQQEVVTNEEILIVEEEVAAPEEADHHEGGSDKQESEEDEMEDGNHLQLEDANHLELDDPPASDSSSISIPPSPIPKEVLGSRGSSIRSSPSPSHSPLGNGTATIMGNGTTGLNLSMTAKEMRNMLASRRKKDPRIDDRMDFRRKHEIIQTL